MNKQWIKDNSGLLVLLVLMAVSAVYAGRLAFSDAYGDRTAVMRSSSRPSTPTGRTVTIRRGEPGWYIGLCTHLVLAATYLGLFIAGVRDRFTGTCVAVMILAFVLQIASVVFLGSIAAALR